jgi:hypothetical protein
LQQCHNSQFGQLTTSHRRRGFPRLCKPYDNRVRRGSDRD